MPEVTFRIRWPDGREEACYSPSTVVREHLSAGASYPLSDFMARSRAALDLAARRVEARYGRRCAAADAQAARLDAAATRYDPQETVTCLSVS